MTVYELTVSDLKNLIADCTKVEIYDCDKSEVVFSGWEYEIPEKFLEFEVGSIEAGNEVLVINI